MKKLFCTLVCLLLAMFTLVSCGDVDRSEWLGNGKDSEGKIDGGNYDGYSTVVDIPQVSLNLYIIVEDETWEGKELADKQGKLGVVTQATNTVSTAVKDYTETNYKTLLNVVYVKASEYDSVVLDAVKANNGEAKAANIVLVNSYALMQDLYATGKLCSLGAYLDTTAYGQLNTKITPSLLEASKIDGSLYSIPNNHVVGAYEYLLVDKDVAKACNVSESQVKAFVSYDEAVAELSKSSAFNNADGSAVALVSGYYEDRVTYDEQGYYCVVVKKPIADKNEAFLSAFAIVDRNEKDGAVDVNNRAMQIIYDLNTKTVLRNILQYGVAGTNYKLDENRSDAVSEMLVGNNGVNLYKMNLLYTGNIFNAFVCDEIDWTEDAIKNAMAQNKDSITVEAFENKNNSTAEE